MGTPHPSSPTALAGVKTGWCLFSAPFEFLGKLVEAYQSLIPTIFKEIWRRQELSPAEDLTAWVVNPGQLFVIDEAILDLYPSLSVLVTPSTGCNHIDLEACTRRGVSVYSLLDDRAALVQISASSEFTFLLLLNTLRRLDVAIQEVSAGRWRDREERLRGHELQGKRVGIIGLGRIGQRLAHYCIAFGARVSYFDPYVTSDVYPTESLEELFSRSEVICLCCRLTPETTGFINHSFLERLKWGACLVNTSRGEVILEQDLADVLSKRPDLRVGLDVLAGEVTHQQKNSPLLAYHQRGQIVITPHMAGATVESQTKAAKTALELLRRHLASAQKGTVA